MSEREGNSGATLRGSSTSQRELEEKRTNENVNENDTHVTVYRGMHACMCCVVLMITLRGSSTRQRELEECALALKGAAELSQRGEGKR